jgi:hypothetical protein
MAWTGTFGQDHRSRTGWHILGRGYHHETGQGAPRHEATPAPGMATLFAVSVGVATLQWLVIRQLRDWSGSAQT